MIVVKKIPFQETFLVRHPVLRKGKPIATCFFQGDDAFTTVHYGVYVDKKIQGVVSIYKNKNCTFTPENQYQIRGMAVLETAQKKGLGKLLILKCEEYIKSKKGELIWFNAREKAVPFYENLLYEKQGDPFDINDIGQHYLMKKLLLAYE